MSSPPTTVPTLDEALDDIEARFLYNLPQSELEQAERLFFQIEQAYWYYEDFKADVYPTLPHFASLKSFATKLFARSALLAKSGDQFQELFADFRNYKSKIPVCGCILLNSKMNKVVLVCDFDGKSWTFPRGKINEKESEYACAVREVLEETGFDASPYCSEDDSLISFVDGKRIRLFIACNVPESAEFCTQTRKEISKVSFYPIDNLPPKTYGVIGFLEKLKRWINKRRQLNAKRERSPQNSAVNASNGKSPARKDSSTSKSRKYSEGKSPSISGSSPLNGGRSSKNNFDTRNNDTFDNDTKRWGVDDMFAANARLTGKSYVYDGNPHQFGASHPKYVNYNDMSSASPAKTVGTAPVSYSDIVQKTKTTSLKGGIADIADVDESFKALSEQSKMGHYLLSLEKRNNVSSDLGTAVGTAPIEFKLPNSAFKFDSTLQKPPRHDSFDTTVPIEGHGRGGLLENDNQQFKIVFPVEFKLDRVAVMAAFDRALSGAL